MVTGSLISMVALAILGSKLLLLTAQNFSMKQVAKRILIVKRLKALGLITQLKALNGNYEVTMKDFDEGKVAFIPMSLAMYRTYKPYPYHVAKYSTFSWSCVTMPASQKVLMQRRFQHHSMRFRQKQNIAAQLGNFKILVYR